MSEKRITNKDAHQIKKLNGERNELLLLNYIHNHQGMSIYEISEDYGVKQKWSYGKVSALVKKLIERGLVRIDKKEINGRTSYYIFENKLENRDITSQDLSVMRQYLDSLIKK